MATFGGPNSVKTGSIILLDVANINSFRGEPTTNLSNNFRDFTGTTYSPNGEWPGTTVTKTYFSELPTPIGPGATLMTESTSSGYQGLSRYGGSNESGAHSLSAFIYPLTSNITEFTIGLLADSSNMIYFNLVTGAITYGAGISNRNSVLESVPNWPGWYRIGANFEGRNGGWVGSMGYRMHTTYSGSGVLRSMYITGVQYELKSYPTPFVSGTRGTTVAAGGGWGDLSGNSNHGELVNNPSFSSDNRGSIVFDGSDDFVRLSNSITISANTNWTIHSVVSSNATASSVPYMRFLGKDNTSANGFFFFEWNNRILSTNNDGTTFAFQTGFTPALPLNNQFFLLTLVGNGGTLELYLNNVKTNVNATISGSLTFDRIMTERGIFTPGGRMAFFLSYNRALSASEIEQNYNAIRGRFGI